MLRISEAQYEGLSRHAEAAFLQRLLAFARRRLPPYRDLPAEAALGQLSGLAARARGHGLTSERQIAVFVVAAHYLGSDCDTARPEVAAALAGRKPPAWKANWLEAFAIMTETRRRRATA